MFAYSAKERCAAYQADWLVLNQTARQTIVEIANATIVTQNSKVFTARRHFYSLTTSRAND